MASTSNASSSAAAAAGGTAGAAQWLKDLPSRNSANFTKFTPDGQQKTLPRKKSALYKIARTSPNEKVIVTNERPLILRYIERKLVKHQQKQQSSSKQSSPSKQKSTQSSYSSGRSEPLSSSDEEQTNSRGGPPRKMPRTT